MELDPASRRVEILDYQLAIGHRLPAAVARFPVARAAPDAGDGGAWQATVGEFFLNQETKDRLVHDGLPGCADSTRQIHRGLGASGANPTRPRCRRGHCAAVDSKAPSGPRSTKTRLRAFVAPVPATATGYRRGRRQGGRCAWRCVLGVVTMTVGKGVEQGGPGPVIPAREADDLIGHAAGRPISRVATHQPHRSANSSASRSRRSSPNASRPPARTARPSEVAIPRRGSGRGGRRGSWETRPPTVDESQARQLAHKREATAEGSAQRAGKVARGTRSR
jgi:hypothetical protein